MPKQIIPTIKEIEHFAKEIPEINPSSVIAMLTVKQVADEIQHKILDVLQKNYQLSWGKLSVMIILYRQKSFVSPSFLSQRAWVTRATISIMLKRMQRDGLVELISNPEDKREKKVRLSSKGEKMINDILPNHYLRISKLMSKLTTDEQRQLIYLLQKIASN